jgi:hypothetical protein
MVIQWRSTETTFDRLPVKAAKQVGLTIPPSVLARADHVIE